MILSTIELISRLTTASQSRGLYAQAANRLEEYRQRIIELESYKAELETKLERLELIITELESRLV